MDAIKIDSFTVKGIAVRTNNVDEMNPDTAKIGALWDSFYRDYSINLSPDAHVFGLYTHYESDHTGNYDVIACSDTLASEGINEYRISDGPYLIFSGIGDMPQIVIDLWRQVWDYFSQQNCPHSRAFTTDFEKYSSTNRVELYIAVKE